MVTAWCHVCWQGIDTADMAMHVHRMHPDIDAWPVTWPDGEPVLFEDLDLIAEV